LLVLLKESSWKVIYKRRSAGLEKSIVAGHVSEPRIRERASPGAV